MGDNTPTPVDRQIRVEQGKIAALFGGVAAAAAAGQKFFQPAWTRRDAVSIGSVAARSALTIYRKHGEGEPITGAELRGAAFGLLLVVTNKTLVAPGTARLSKRDRTLGIAAGLAWSGAVALLTAYLAATENRLSQLEHSGS